MSQSLPSPARLPRKESIEIRPLAVRVREACRLTGIGRSKLYMLINEGHIETVKVGSMTLILMRSLETLLGVGTR